VDRVVGAVRDAEPVRPVWRRTDSRPAANRRPGTGPCADNGVVPTVLLVDDHAAFRRRARRLLEAEGWTVAGEAADGAGGLELARRLRPDLALVDVGLPDTTGLALARVLAVLPGAPACVLVSTHDRADFEALARRAGALGFLAKEELDGEALTGLLARHGPSG
jgi:DNA-binding NarL/FixJ family response regulator